MSSFEDLKKKAEAQVAQDQAVMQSWVKAHRGWLIAVGIAALAGFILAKVL